MARSRTLTEIADEAYRYADAEGMTARHPRADVVRWCNKGLAELYDMLVSARGLDWYRATTTIALVSGTTDYALPATFYQVLGVRMLGGGALQPFGPAQSAELRDGYVQGQGAPAYYQLAAANITFLPVPGSGSVVLDYVPAFVDLADDAAATFDGVNAWEDYGSLWAARRMGIKDSDDTKVGMLVGEMAAMAARIRGLARLRDPSAAGRIKDVRGAQAHAAFRRFR